MIRLLYISTARQPHSPEGLAGILRVSRRNNLAADVTGLLVAGGRRFLQVLEGAEPQVRAIYERIARDPRHFATVVLDERPVDARLFGAWAMGFQQGGSGGADGDVAALIAPIADASVRAYFSEFAVRHAA